MFFILCIILLLLIYYMKRSYFTMRSDLPGLSPNFLFGNLIQSGILFNGVSIANALCTFRDRFGDAFQFWLGSSRLIIISGIEDVKHILTHRHIYDKGDLALKTFGILFSSALIANRGAKYKRHSTLLLPLFRRGKIISNFDIMINNVDKLLARWRNDNIIKIHQDIVEQCQHLVLSIFGFIAFDYDLETLDGKDNTGNELTLALQESLTAFRALMYLPYVIGSLYWKLNPRYRHGRKVIQRYLFRMIEQEFTENEESRIERKRKCFIASLVSSLQKDEVLELKKSEEEKQGLSRQEVLDEMLLFLIAGYETTSTTLAWFIYLISKHPQVQQKLKAELMDNNGNKLDLSPDRIESFVYLDCVINEVLRFCPPIMGAARTLAVDDCLPESGTQLHKGDQVFISFYSLAHDNRVWNVDPELFYPERFIDEDKNHHPFAFLPFGHGHRQCFGRDLARFELKVLVARMMQQITFGDGGSQLNSGGHLVRLTIMPKHVGVTINFD